MTISAEHGRGMYEMWETILNLVPEEMRNTWADDDWEEESDSGELSSNDDEEDSEEGLTRPIEEIRVAILGRPNIGSLPW